MAMKPASQPLRFTAAWALLVLATLTAFAFREMAPGHSHADRLAITIVLVTAFAKCLIIGLQFMELRHAPRMLRYAFFVWTTAVCTTLVLLLER